MGQTYASRALRLFPMYLMEQGLEGLLQHLVLGALVELAYKMPASL